MENNNIGKVGRRLGVSVFDDIGKDHKSHMLKHSYEKTHKILSSDDFRIPGVGFSKSRFKRKISEALFIQQLQPSLNTQDIYVPLKLLK